MLNGSEPIGSLNVDANIERGLDFLRRSQLPSGEFKVYMSSDLTPEKECVVDSSPFPTALIAYSLGFTASPVAKAMLDQVARFFLAEMEGPGLWRYWTRGHQYHSIIPPDLDDVACVSQVLRRQDVAFPANLKLILLNRNRQGLFYTWITPRWPLPLNLASWQIALRQWLRPIRFYYFWKLNESERHDIDCVVNANVLLYLGERAETLPVIDYLIEIVRNRKETCCDKWHLNGYTFYYTVSRNFFAGTQAFAVVRDELIERIVAGANDDGSIGATVLETALAVCALHNLKCSPPELKRAILFLLEAQRTTGEWPRAVMYYGGPKRYYGWGSEELTTGFCLEALLRLRETDSPG